MSAKKERIEIIDALRGFSVVLMVIHHLLYDCVEFLGAPEWLFTNPVFDVLHYIFAGLFILLSGISSRFSRGNVKRGLKVIAVAAAISLVTYLMDMPIWFGILHLLGFSMLFFGLTQKLWDAIPRKAAPVAYIASIVAGALATAYIPLKSRHIWMFGWSQPDFVIYDYFPLLPWLFVFILGTWAGIYIVEKKLPAWFYEKKIPFFPAIGKKSLLIYILHQPILFVIVKGVAILC
ncbi:MAG: DUF1624 domain-containing protein [Oscillospiraceae bacterium]|jgi:uncharacterized membrane protein|nr:DUF1624 domain-containing protein [Oscillospiraceae bacterium]